MVEIAAAGDSLEIRKYFDGSPDLYCELDAAGVFLFVGGSWKQTLGYLAEEMIGRQFTTFLHPNDITSSTAVFQDKNSPGKGLFRNRYRHKNGKYRTLLWSGRFDPRRNVMLTHARDVTDEMLRSSMLIRVAAIQDAYIKQSTNRREVFDSVLLEILRGCESEHGFIGEISENLLSGKKFLGVHAVTDGLENENLSALAASVIDHAKVSMISNKIDLPPPIDGGPSSIQSFLGIPLFYQGEFVGIFGVINRHGGYDEGFKEDLRPLIETAASVLGLCHASIRENALRERFHVIVENMPIMLTEYGPEGHITWANKYFHEKTGSASNLSSSELLKQVMFGDAEARRAEVFMLSGSKEWRDFEMRNKDGKSFPSTWTNIRMKDGRAIGIGQDLTDRRLAEEKMVQSSKMASLGQMSAGVSHEINNPLAIIQGSAFRAIQNLSDKTGKLDQVEGDLNRIIQNCQRIASIVRGLRAFSRSAEHEPFIPTLLKTVIEDVLNLAQERFKSHNIQIKIEGESEIVVDCRTVQLVQVLMNLLNNAFDAVIEQNDSQKSVWIVTKTLDSNHIEISVEDSGAGIALELQNRILEPFFTTKDVGKGTGLGLSISKGLIESHGGRLWLDTASKRTRFVIELPIRHDPKT
jgi:PAS domain S-box-containing protein